MKLRLRKRALLGGGLALLAAVIVAVALAPDLGNNSARAVPPGALKRIATKNDNAASIAAADLRARSAASAAAADARRDAQDRGGAAGNAAPARSGNERPATVPPVPAR